MMTELRHRPGTDQQQQQQQQQLSSYLDDSSYNNGVTNNNNNNKNSTDSPRNLNGGGIRKRTDPPAEKFDFPAFHEKEIRIFEKQRKFKIMALLGVLAIWFIWFLSTPSSRHETVAMKLVDEGTTSTNTEPTSTLRGGETNGKNNNVGGSDSGSGAIGGIVIEVPDEDEELENEIKNNNKGNSNSNPQPSGKNNGNGNGGGNNNNQPQNNGNSNPSPPKNGDNNNNNGGGNNQKPQNNGNSVSSATTKKGDNGSGGGGSSGGGNNNNNKSQSNGGNNSNNNNNSNNPSGKQSSSNPQQRRQGYVTAVWNNQQVCGALMMAHQFQKKRTQNLDKYDFTVALVQPKEDENYKLYYHKAIKALEKTGVVHIHGVSHDHVTPHIPTKLLKQHSYEMETMHALNVLHLPHHDKLTYVSTDFFFLHGAPDDIMQNHNGIPPAAFNQCQCKDKGDKSPLVGSLLVFRPSDKLFQDAMTYLETKIAKQESGPYGLGPFIQSFFKERAGIDYIEGDGTKYINNWQKQSVASINKNHVQAIQMFGSQPWTCPRGKHCACDDSHKQNMVWPAANNLWWDYYDQMKADWPWLENDPLFKDFCTQKDSTCVVKDLGSH